MKKTTTAVTAALLLCLALLCTASAVDATSAWDSVAHAYRFKTTAEVNPATTTFSQGYMGNPLAFATDFAGIKGYVSGVCGAPVHDPTGDEYFSALWNW